MSICTRHAETQYRGGRSRNFQPDSGNYHAGLRHEGSSRSWESKSIKVALATMAGINVWIDEQSAKIPSSDFHTNENLGINYAMHFLLTTSFAALLATQVPLPAHGSPTADKSSTLPIIDLGYVRTPCPVRRNQNMLGHI
jgi:hypothetical protein